MASVEERPRSDGAMSFRVVWREGGRKQSETFDDKARAHSFRDDVRAAGESWPLDWIKGRATSSALRQTHSRQPSVTSPRTSSNSKSDASVVAWSSGTRKGVRLEVISEMLGHASIQITYDIFGGMVDLKSPVLAQAMTRAMLTAGEALVPNAPRRDEVAARTIRPGSTESSRARLA